ncbi:Uncharacterized protein PECH_006226 [Penicillium ucsense]|uniref:Uncharacterized protein n=1 Tax=Penicillium ucsense TaxID=2839758 RepID=A0A8J8WJN8_9EURO|nr:Uncharacterized protein PECM_006550 [Penicillium ucsense]KAF7735758.1 Uncharacterized protein PECH_006226 [Penicillium ucsense]
MPSKKASRKSMPAQVKHEVSSSAPSRRSRRISLAGPDTKALSDSSDTTLVPSSNTSESAGPPLNIHFYTPKPPKSPSTASRSAPHSKPQSPSRTPPQSSTHTPDVTSKRRSTFKPRPSRLSSVFPPSAETPKSVASSRRTRRTAAFETPRSTFSEHDLSESFGSTGWTYSQYMGGAGIEGASDPRLSPTASSIGTRSSTRLRKPTAKALEAMQTQPKTHTRSQKKDVPPSINKASAPDPSSNSLAPTAATAATAATAPTFPPSIASSASATTVSPGRTGSFSKITFKNGLKRGNRAAVTPKTQSDLENQSESDRKKGQKVIKPSPQVAARKGKKDKDTFKGSVQRIQITIARAGQKLFEAAAAALEPDFTGPTNAEQFIKDLRAARCKKFGLGKEEDASGHAPEAVVPRSSVDEPSPAQPKDKLILKLKLSTAPFVDEDNWAHTGRVNDQGEELILMPAGCSLDRAPHTYGDRSLPHPPIRARPEIQVMTDFELGYPPLIGERNSPFAVTVTPQQNEKSEGHGKAPARGTKALAGQKEAQKGGRKRRLVENGDGAADGPPKSPATPDSQKGQRASKRRAVESLASASKSASKKQTPRETPALRSSKAKPSAKIQPSSPGEVQTPSSKVQRLRITVKPQSVEGTRRSSRGRGQGQADA